MKSTAIARRSTFALSFCLSACAAGSSPGSRAAGTTTAVIASLHAEKCGTCHTPPRPQTRSRAYLEEALGRHRKRVHLDDDKWQALVDYLAATDKSGR